MFDDRLRSIKDIPLRPLVRLAAGARVSPTAVTVVGLIAGLAAAVTAAASHWTPATVLWIVNRLLDGLDGALARATGSGSDAGGYMDILADFVVYAAIPLGIAAGASQAAVWPAAAVLLATCYVNAASWMYLAAILEKRGRYESRRTAVAMPRGFVEGAETIVAYTIALLLPRYAAIVFWLLAVLVLLTATRRAAWWLRETGWTCL